MNPALQTVNLDFTTHCDQRCADCCCGIGINRELRHHSWEYFEHAAAILRGIPRVNLCGGEPTLHPHFASFVPRLKKLFACERLTMVTDGWGLLKHFEVIAQHFDAVEFSDYQIGRAGIARALAQRIPVTVFDAGRKAANFTKRVNIGGGGPCDRAVFHANGFAYADGKLYGCCVAPGIASAQAVDAAPGWDFAIYDAPLPCAACWFSV